MSSRFREWGSGARWHGERWPGVLRHVNGDAAHPGLWLPHLSFRAVTAGRHSTLAARAAAVSSGSNTAVDDRPAPLTGQADAGPPEDGPPGAGGKGRPPRRPPNRRWIAALRPYHVRVLALLAMITVVVAGVVEGGWGQDPSAEPTAQHFLLAWQQGNYRAAAGYTTGRPAAVAARFRAVNGDLDATGIFLSMGSIVQHGDTATARFTASVNLGQGEHKWTYQGSFLLHRYRSGWKIEWRPSVINPQLGPGDRLALLTTLPPRAPVLDASGQPLTTRSPVYVAGVRPGSLTSPAATAAALAAATGLTSNQLLRRIQAAPPAALLDLVSLSPRAYQRSRRLLDKVPGLRVRKVSERLLTSSVPQVVGTVGTETVPALRNEGEPYQPGTTIGLTGVEAAYQGTLEGTPTTDVVVVDGSGRRTATLRTWSGQKAAPVRTTIDAGVQSAAHRAVVDASTASDGAGPGAATSAEIVAIQPSTGHVLAVAGRGPATTGATSNGATTNGTNDGAAGDGASATNGGTGATSTPDVLDTSAPAGATFTIVSTAALLRGGFPVASVIPCPAQTDVGGGQFDTGSASPGAGMQASFRTDFADGCRTAFAGLSRRLSPGQLEQTALGFGIGAKWRLPLATFSGSVPVAASDAQLAGETDGDGVQASPLGMAVVAADVASGVRHSPVLVTDPPDAASAAQLPLTADALGSLRSLMRSAVISGSARAANVPGPAVYGLAALVHTGNSRHGSWDSWFVGYRDNVAFAVLVSGATPQTSAAATAADFLRDLPTGG